MLPSGWLSRSLKSEVRRPSRLSHDGGGRIGGRVRECARFCTSISENSIAGAAAETGTLPDSAPHTPLNTSVLSPVIFNPVQRGQRRAHDVYAAHQFIRTAVGINLPHQHRQYLERLRQRARGQGESAFDVFEVKAVGLALLLDFVDQLLPQFRIFDRVGTS